MSVVIAGIGTWLPPDVRRNGDWPESFAQGGHRHGDRTFNEIPPPEDPEAARILARDLEKETGDPFLGAVERRVADDGVSAVDAQTSAARAALDDAFIPPSAVDLVIANAMVPDRLPSVSAQGVMHRIGASPRARAIDVEAVCASALVHLEVAAAYVEAGLADVVLVVQSHLLLRTAPMTHPAMPGLGDGATAMVVTRGDRGLILRSVACVSHGEFDRAVTYVRGHDDAADPPWWKTGGDYRLGSRNPAQVKLLMRDTVSFGAKTVTEAADRAGIPVDGIGVLASVQPRGFIPGAIAERLGLPRERAVTTYEQIAHVGVCGPVFNLARARSLGLLGPGATVALYAQGAGFTRAAAVLRVV